MATPVKLIVKQSYTDAKEEVMSDPIQPGEYNATVEPWHGKWCLTIEGFDLQITTRVEARNGVIVLE